MGGFSVTNDGWMVEPRPSVPALAEGFKAPAFVPIAEVISEMTGLSEERLTEIGGVPEPLHARSHIDDWNTFGDLLGPDGVKALMRAVQ